MQHISLSALFSLLVFLIVLSAFFSGSEIGMMSLNRYRLRHLAKQKNRSAQRVSQLLIRPDRLLGVILIGNTFANIFAASLATLISVRLFGDIGVAIGTIVLTLIILIFAEVAPKTVAALYPQRVAFLASWPLRILLFLLSPLVWLTNTVANGLLRLLQIKIDVEKNDHLSQEELRTVVYEAGNLIPSDHKEMLVRILDLGAVTVDDIMVPRSEIVGIDLDEDWEDILEDLENSQHTRLPVYVDSIDKVVGIVHLRSVLNLIADERLNKEALRTISEDAYFVPEGTPLNTQLMNFKAAKCRSGLVVDEYGDIQGLVTMEDILEEIVGQFTTDMATLSRDVHPQEDGSYVVDGGAMLRDLNRSMGWQFPCEGPKTLSGLIIEYLEYIPSPGTGLKIADHPIEIIQVKDNKIKTIKVLPKQP